MLDFSTDMAGGKTLYEGMSLLNISCTLKNTFAPTQRSSGDFIMQRLQGVLDSLAELADPRYPASER